METIYHERRKQLIENLQYKEVSHVLIFDPANIFYLTGFLSEPHEGFMALYIDVVKQEEHLFVPALDKEAADITSIITISDDENPFIVTKNVVHHMDGIVGIEGDVLQYNRFIQLQHYFPNIHVTDIQPILNKHRMEKSTEEIESTKTAIHLIEQVGVIKDGYCSNISRTFAIEGSASVSQRFVQNRT